MFIPGSNVTRITPYSYEICIVKRAASATHTFVVYHCNDDWDNYRDYTAASTDNQELLHGWITDAS